MNFNRRDFLALVGGAAAGYGATCIPLRSFVGLRDLGHRLSSPGVEEWIRTSCQLCPGACGMEIRNVDGHPVGVRGNHLHPISRGGLCPVGAEAMHVLYSPDRLRAPLQRVGGDRGQGQWMKITWEAALSGLREKLQGLVSSGRPERIYLLDGYDRGLLSELAQRFLESLGSPSYYVDRAPNPVHAAMYLAQGVDKSPAYDLDRAKSVLSFGVPLLEGWDSPVQGQRAVGGIRGAVAEGSTRQLLQLDVRYSKTAHRADTFVQVKPGSYGAVALAIAYVLIRKNLFDSEFVEQHTFGFEDWVDADEVTHDGFKSFVLRECRPQDLESVTGVSARTIVEVAQAFCEARPAVAIVDGTATACSNGVQMALAIHALNALMGSIDQRGGSLFAEPVPFTAWPSSKPEDGNEGRAAESTRRFPLAVRDTEALIREVVNSGEKISVLFLLHSNPFFSAPHAERLAELVDEDSLIVSFSPIPDESQRLADLILPDHTFLERWQDAVSPRSYPNSVLGITRPVTTPLYDTRHSGDVLLELARTSTRNGQESFPWPSFEHFLENAGKGVFQARRGTVFTSEDEASEIEEMERRGWWIPSHEDFDSFWKEALATGGWWDPAFRHGLWGRVLRTPSKKYEFFSQALLELARGDGHDADAVASRLQALGISASGDRAFLPHHEPPEWTGEKGTDSLLLQLVRPMVPNTAWSTSLPWIRELLNSRVAWETWAEIHPDDASRLGLEEGQLLRLSSGPRSFVARALLTSSVQPGIVSVPHGLGRTAGSRWSRTRGSSPNHVVSPVPEKLAGTTQWQGSRVRVAPDGEGVSHA